MKIVLMTVVLILLFAALAIGGNVYGTLTENGKAVAQAKLEVTCGANKYNTETDANGAFKLFVKDQGKCSLAVSHQGQTAAMDINSFEGSVQYDIVLEKQGNQYTLKRK